MKHETKLRPLDIVELPTGTLAVVTELTNTINGQIAVEYLNEGVAGDKNAWWDPRQLKFKGNIPNVLARATASTTVSARETAKKIY